MDKFLKKRDDNHVNRLFKELVQIVNWPNDESDDGCIYEPSYESNNN